MPSLSGVVAVSRFLLDGLEAAGLALPRAAVIPSGTDTQAFRPGETEPGLVLFAGRFVEKKAPLDALRAFAAGGAGARLEMIGDGPLLADAQALARELGLGDRVRFAGALPHAELRERMRTAEVLLQPFRTAPDGDAEGMPGVVQEGMACGVPVIATRHAGVGEHVTSGQTGFLAEPGDVDTLATTLARVLSDRGLREDVGARARAYAVAHLDYRDLIARLEAFMLEGAAPDPRGARGR
jgi:glycosyltransferase involved in cell wall biosynthesis